MALGEKWRDRIVWHRTPGGKLTRKKISSLTSDEQQKYNPNRYKRSGANTNMTPDQYKDLQQKEIKSGQIFNFYVQIEDEKLTRFGDNDNILATTDGKLVPGLFPYEDGKKIVKLKKVPMDAIKEIIKAPEGGELDYGDLSGAEIQNIDSLEDKERYEAIKFNDADIALLDISPYIDSIEIVSDDPVDRKHAVGEGLERATEYITKFYIGE